MEQPGTNTLVPQITQNNNTHPELITLQQELFVRFLAIGGLMTEESDDPGKVQNIRQMTVSEFIEKTGIPRTTFYRWRKTIPNLSERIREARNTIFGEGRETALHNRAYLIAMTSKDHKAAGDMIKMLLGHSGKLELPIQRQEVEHKGESWVDFIKEKHQNAIEAEIVNDPQVNNP